MRSRKLSKSIKAKNCGEWSDSNDSPDLTFKTSINELKSQPSRQSLRQHFTGAFPETKLRPSLALEEAIESSNMRARHKLSRPSSNITTNHAPDGVSSSLTMSVNDAEFKRLSTVRESNGKIDVAEVIRLLQELRRTASPAELVALHKALLPTNDSVIHTPPVPSPIDYDAFPIPPSSFVRRRSMLPPGVATRPACEDPLPTRKEAIAGVDRTRPQTHPTSKSEIAALDLADDASRVTLIRALTPMDHDEIPMGAFRHGTLRVTNGTASPDPYAIRKSREVDDQALEVYRVQEDFETAPSSPNFDECFEPDQINTRNNPSRSSVLSFKQKWQRSENSNEYPQSDKEICNSQTSRRSSAPAMTVTNVPRIAEASSSKPKTTPFERVSMSHDHSRKALPPRIEKEEQAPLETHQSLDVSPLKQRDGRTLPQSVDGTCKQATDEVKDSAVVGGTLQPSEPPSKPEMPRFAQRWSHRLSHMSTEARSGSPLPSNPFEDNAALQSLSKRLSTVTDRTVRERNEEASAARETPEVALAKLNGEIDSRNFIQTQEVASNDAGEDQFSSTESRCETGRRPSQPQKTDSGYGSDISHLSMEQQEERESCKVYQNALPDVAEHAHKAYQGLAVENDEISLYSFNQVLKSPYLLSGLATPSPPDARGSKKHLSLLGLNKTKRSNSLQAQSPTDATLDQVPLEAKAVKPSKRLQKAMPISVRKHVKSEVIKDEGKRSETPVILDLHDDLEDTYAPRHGLNIFPSSTSSVSPMETIKAPRRNSQPTKPSYAPFNNSSSKLSPAKIGGGKEAFPNVIRDLSTGSNVTSERPSEYFRNRRESSRTSGSTTPKAPHQVTEGNTSSELAQSNIQNVPAQTEVQRVEHSRQAGLSADVKATFTTGPVSPAPVVAVSPSGDAASSHGLPKLADRSQVSNATSIQPLPKLSARVSKRISGFEAIAPKRPTDSGPPKPMIPTLSGSDRPGDSTESIADVVNRAVQARKTQGAKQGEDGQGSDDFWPAGVHKSKAKRKARKAQPREFDNSDTEALEVLTSGERGAGALPTWTRDIERSRLEMRAKTRRDRGEGTGQKSGESNPLDERLDGILPDQPFTPPVIVVSSAATPPTAEKARRVSYEPSSSVELSRIVRQDFHHDGEEAEREDDVELRNSTITVVRVHDSANRDLEKNNSTNPAYSTKSYDAPGSQIERSRSPGGRVVTPFGKYHPYTPADGVQAKIAHAESLARLVGAT